MFELGPTRRERLDIYYLLYTICFKIAAENEQLKRCIRKLRSENSELKAVVRVLEEQAKMNEDRKRIETHRRYLSHMFKCVSMCMSNSKIQIGNLHKYRLYCLLVDHSN